jgi:GMP synthase (glutamine-hydrolysing)
MKPFLFLQIRPEYDAAENEYQTIKSIANVDIDRERICHVPFPEIDLSKYSGVILGGGPATISDSEIKKPDYQRYFEPKLFDLLKWIIKSDFPFIGLCFGPAALVTALDGLASKRYPEKVGAYNIELTDQGRVDRIFKGIPYEFKAFAGHKESVERLPQGAVVLATSELCPVQGFKIGNNVYAFQFHPELDADGLAVRINTYKNMGYFEPEEAESLINMARSQDVTFPRKILANYFDYFYN